VCVCGGGGGGGEPVFSWVGRPRPVWGGGGKKKSRGGENKVRGWGELNLVVCVGGGESVPFVCWAWPARPCRGSDVKMKTPEC